MKKFFVAMSLVAFAVVGCDDSSSASAGPNEEPLAELSSSSSDKVIEPVEVTSSSSEKEKPSSSKNEESSSSVKPSSSSSVILSASEESSSSSVDPISSSSLQSDKLSSSNSEKTLLSSCSSGFVWNLPKEAYLNPGIDYGTMTDERDSKVYKTVKIGDQVWMAENLNYDPGQGGSGENKYDWSWCYGVEPKNCDVAGRLYTWAAAMDSVKLANDAENPQDCGYGKECGLTGSVQGVCPEGWHLPSQTEWNTLFTAVGGQSTAGKVLKSQTGWHKNNGTDAFGFAVLPTGLGAPKGTFDYVGWLAYFWSSTESDSSRACSVAMDYYYVDAGLGNITKYFGYSVRCVKD